MPRESRSPSDLLPLVYARPAEAVVAARALLAAAPGPYDASVAHQVLGLYERDFGDLSAGVDHLRTARRWARRAGSHEREADVLAALGVALVHSGRTRPGLAALDRALSLTTGAAAARVRFRRGGVHWILGRHEEALEDLRAALPVLRRAGDVVWTARVLNIKATVLLALGSVDRAVRDFEEAGRLWEQTGQDHDKVVVIENRGLAAFRSGDIPAALREFDEAARGYVALGTPMFMLELERCAALLAAGLPAEALRQAERALRLLERQGGPSTRRAQLLLTAAQAALAAGRPEAALARAEQAITLFSRQGRPWWSAHARLVRYRARFAIGSITVRLVRDCESLAATLAGLNSPESVQAWLLAGRAALALGRGDDADRCLARAAGSRHSGPVLSRIDAWLAHALRAKSARQKLAACRSGLALLDEYQMTLGATELRARATALGAELSALAQRTGSQSPRRLLEWSERWRATVLSVPPVRPPEDPELLRELTAFRELAHRSDEAHAAGTPRPELDRQRSKVERRIRARSMQLAGTGAGRDRRFEIGELLGALGERRLVEIVEIDGELQAIVCVQGKAFRVRVGTLEEAARENEFLQTALARLAHSSAGRLADVERAAGDLQDILFPSAALILGTEPLVIVPPARLHAVPWAALPALRDRAFTVAPSASSWLRARGLRPVSEKVLLVRGPELQTCGAELPALADLYPKATVLEDGTATTQAVLNAMDGARVAHLAAHGTFRADSPMFTSLRMDDGPLTVFDVESLKRAPHLIVLSSCDSGRQEAVGADELLGLTSALLPLGTAGIVACQVPVNDEATVPLMIALHEALTAGSPLGEALRIARQTTSNDPVHQATAWSFAALGAG